MQSAAADLTGSPQGKKCIKYLFHKFIKFGKIEEKIQNTIDFDFLTQAFKPHKIS